MNLRGGIAFEVSHRFTRFWHLWPDTRRILHPRFRSSLIWICKPYPTCWQSSILYLTLPNHLIVLVAFLAKLWLSKISKNFLIHHVQTTTSPVKLILSYSYLHRWLSPFPRSLNIRIIHDTISIEEDRIIGNLTIATAGLMFFGAHIGARTNGLRISGKHICT